MPKVLKSKKETVKEEPKKAKNKKEAVKKEVVKEEPKKAPTFPAKLPSPKNGVTYIRQDKLTYKELIKKVESNAHYPMRVLMREDRTDHKVTEFIICYVGRWVNCIDINSTEDKYRESTLRFNEKEFLDRECGGVTFAVYEIVKMEEVEPEEEEEMVVEEKPKKEKKSLKKKK